MVLLQSLKVVPTRRDCPQGLVNTVCYSMLATYHVSPTVHEKFLLVAPNLGFQAYPCSFQAYPGRNTENGRHHHAQEDRCFPERREDNLDSIDRPLDDVESCLVQTRLQS